MVKGWSSRGTVRKRSNLFRGKKTESLAKNQIF